MPENKVQIVVEVDAKTGQAIIRQLGAEMETAGHKGAAGFGQASAGVDRLGDGVDRVKRHVLGLATQLGMAWGAADIIKAADTMRAMDTRLLLTARNTADYAAAQKSVVDIARQSHQELSGVATLYNRMALSTANLNVAQADLADVTKTVALSVALSGSASQESAAGMLQFAQAMGSGRLQGDELRSVMENMPQLAKILVDAAGGSMAKFREMSKNGELTTEWMINSIKKALPEMEAMAAGMPITVGMALNDMKTSAALYIDEENKATSATGNLATTIEFLGQHLDTVAKGGALVLTGALGMLAGRGIAAVVSALPGMLAYLTAAATVTETAAVATTSYTIAMETTSRVSAGALATSLVGLVNPVTAITTVVGLGAAAWMLWGEKAETATDKAKRAADEAARLLQMQKEISDPHLKQADLGQQRAAAQAEVDRLAAAGHRHINALGDVIVTGEYAKAEQTLAYWKKAYNDTQQSMELTAKRTAGARIGAEMSVSEYEKQQIAERTKATADALGKKLLDIEDERQAELKVARDRFKNADDLARAEQAVNSRFSAEAGKARSDAAAKAAKGQASAMRELTKTMDDYRDAVMASLPEEEQAVARVKKEYDTYRESIADGLKRHPELAGEAAKAMAALDQKEQEATKNALDGLKSRKDATKELKQVADSYAEAVLASLPEEQQAIERLAKEYDTYRESVVDWGSAMIAAGKDSAVVMGEVYKRLDMLDARQSDATIRALDGLKDKNDQIKKIWEHTYDNLQDLTADWLYKMEISWSSVGDLFRKMVSQMVAAWAWGQASMAWGNTGSTAATGSTGLTMAGAGTALASIGGAAAIGSMVSGPSTGKEALTTAGIGAAGIGLEAYNSTGGQLSSTLMGTLQDRTSDLATKYLSEELGSSISNLSSSAFSGWAAGIGTFLIDLMQGKSFKDSAIQGVGAGLGAWAGGVVGSYVPWIGTYAGAMIGSVIGSWIGGLFGSGSKENQFTITELVQKGITDTVFEKTQGMLSTGFTTGPATSETGEWYNPIANAYSEMIGIVNDSFTKNVFDFANTLPATMKNLFLDKIAATDYTSMLSSASQGRWGVSQAQGVLTGVAQQYADALAKSVQDSYNAALITFVSTADPSELLGPDLQQTWFVLNAAAQSQVKSMFEAAGKAMSTGGIAAGITEMQKVTDAMSSIKTAMQPIQEIIDTNGLSEQELAVRKVRQEFDQYRTSLVAAGVDMEKFPQFAEALAISLDKAAASTSNLTEETQKFAAATATAEDNLRSAYEREASVFQGTIDQFTKFATELRQFKQGLLLGDLSTLSPEEKYAEAKRQYEAIANRAQLGDTDAIGQLQGVSQSFLTASKGYYASTADYAADFSKVSQVLDSTASVADRQASIAQQQLSVLTSQVSALITINQSVLSVREAIAALDFAKDAQTVAGGGLPSSAITAAAATQDRIASGSLVQSVADMYQRALGREADPAGLTYWSVALANAGGDLAAIKDSFFSGAAANGESVSRFAAGGNHYGGLRIVGENGPELEETGPSRIYNATDTRRMLTGGSDAETKALLRELIGLHKQVIFELRADKAQRGAVGVATIGKLDAVVDRLDGTKREIRRQAV